MKKPLFVGAVLGLLITGLLVFWYQGLQQPGGTGSGLVLTTSGEAETDAANAPRVSVFAGFNADFPGSKDLLTHRARGLPVKITTPNWDRAIGALGLPTNQSVTEGCKVTDVSPAITVRSDQASMIVSGQTNVLFLGGHLPRCLASQSTVAIVVEDPFNVKSIYEMPVAVKIERLIEVSFGALKPELLQQFGTSREDLPFHIAGSREWINVGRPLTAIQFSLTSQMPSFDPRKIPDFMPGVQGLRPTAIKGYMRALEAIEAPILVDTRDPQKKSGGTLPGALNVPFKAANERQLQFQLDMPLTLAAGATIDTSGLPEKKLTPLVLFGNDERDASVVWVARNLRLIGYRRVFFVIGGFEAIKKETPNLRL